MVSSNGKFEASRYLTKLKGKDYLEVKWRLLWLRTEQPDAIIATELHTLGEGLAVFKATVTLPSGASATGWGSETAADFGDWLEKAETKAIGRALAALGFGTQFCDDHAFGADVGHVVDSPVQQPASMASTPKPAPRTTTAAQQEGATTAQVRAIYTIGRNEHGLSEQEVDDRALQTYGQITPFLSKREASEFIDKLKGTVAR